MKKRLQIILVALLISGCASFAKAQQIALSPEKRKLIGEVVALTKINAQFDQVAGAMLESLEKSYPQIVEQAVGNAPGLNPTEKTELRNAMIARQQSFIKKFRERLPQAINYNQYIETAVYPLYDKFFNESELRDLIAFYKTVTGQKTIEALPEIFAESLRVAQTDLSPQIARLTEAIMTEELLAIEQTEQSQTPKRQQPVKQPPKRKSN